MVDQYTKYPDGLDDSSSLPLSTDLVTPVKAEVTNRLRSAILAVEAELAPQVSGTFSTVKARLDALDGTVSTHYADLLARIAFLQSEIDILNAEVAALIAGGGSGGGITPAKIRVYRGSSQTNASPATNLTVIWSGGASSLLAATNASLAGGQTTISTTQAGTYQINGQLTIAPSAGIVQTITIEILKNGSVVETVQDNNVVWGVGLNRSFSFRVALDLLVSDSLTVRWRHGGNVGSATQITGTDDSTWLSLHRTN